MNSFTSGSTTTNYLYRSDGMRVQKAVPSGNSTSFAYDGQMGFEDTDAGSNAAVNDYAIGPRGIDRIAQTTAGGTNIAYPIYDGHGNMTCTILPSYGTTGQLEDTRSFDAWGNASAIGNQQVDPKGRYCANLGHKQDDESGLVYMRARYYDPTVGRYVSEDPNLVGANWTTYCDNNPIGLADRDGGTPTALWGAGVILALISMAVSYFMPDNTPTLKHAKAFVEDILNALNAFLLLRALPTLECTASQEAFLGASFGNALLGCLALGLMVLAAATIFCFCTTMALIEMVHLTQISLAIADIDSDSG